MRGPAPGQFTASAWLKLQIAHLTRDTLVVLVPELSASIPNNSMWQHRDQSPFHHRGSPGDRCGDRFNNVGNAVFSTVGMQVIVQPRDLGIVTIHRQQILSQVVNTN